MHKGLVSGKLYASSFVVSVRRFSSPETAIIGAGRGKSLLDPFAVKVLSAMEYAMEPGQTRPAYIVTAKDLGCEKMVSFIEMLRRAKDEGFRIGESDFVIGLREAYAPHHPYEGLIFVPTGTSTLKGSGTNDVLLLAAPSHPEGPQFIHANAHVDYQPVYGHERYAFTA